VLQNSPSAVAMNLDRKDKAFGSNRRIRHIIFVTTTMMMMFQIVKSFTCDRRISIQIINGSAKLYGAHKHSISTTARTIHRRCSCEQNNHQHPSKHRRSISSCTQLFASTSQSSSSSDYSLVDVQRDFRTATELYQENVKATPKNLDIIVEELETESADPSFWDAENKDRNALVTAQMSKYGRLQNRIKDWQRLKEDGEVAIEMLAMTGDNEEESSSEDEPLFTDAEYASLVEELKTSTDKLLRDGELYKLELLLSGPYDDQPCRILLTAGAGGTEANDWVADLKRMYERHALKMGYSTQIEDEQQGDVVGYKSVEMIISAPVGGGDGTAQHPYGWFKGEKGTHRLVRLSPFNANNKRQTTFAGVDVAPIFLDETDLNDMDIPDKDLEITTMRSGGAGGQNVNKVSSAVRIKHLPSGLNVKCTQERSQAMNKNLAMNRLKSQLIAIAKEQRVADYQEIRGDQVEASWGMQIRNYVMHPYKMVKDQRTGWETSNVQNFMDGDLEDCIAELLKNQAKDEQAASLQEADNQITSS
jgi:peptide chain release factor 2